MPIWASAEDVQSRVTYGSVSATSKPSTDQVEQWLDEAEAQIRAILRAAGLATAYTDSDSVNLLIMWATDYATGQLLKAWGRQGNDELLEEGQALLERFDATIQRVRSKTIAMGTELDSGGNVADSAQQVRSYTTDNSDGKTVARGDFAPVITNTEVF